MERVVLIGLSGTGKSSVARGLAARLGFECVDIDDEIERRFDASVPQIFADYGESVFRAAEQEAIASACSGTRRVIATGGGAVTSGQNWLAMRPDTLVVHLRASPDEILRRLHGQVASDPDTRRPLLESRNPREALDRLWQARRSLYELADVSIDTTGSDLETVVSEVEAHVAASLAGKRYLPIGSIGTAGGRSDLYVASGLLAHAGRLARARFQNARRAWILTDSNVGPLWASHVTESLHAGEFTVERLDVPAGEQSKSISQVSDLADALLNGRIDRLDVVVALGGGVIGDLAGFVAAIVLRGVGLIQIPTSLLAMVDSSVGGKTGINHARGKNLIGAFYQPQLVLADPLVLETLPGREMRGGWAEIIKHGMIESTATSHLGAGLFDVIASANDEQIGDPDFLADIVRRNVLIKRSVVQADERESGLRRILNYGHTLGHAMEASGYRYHHGEAIALGMRAAADLALRIGRSSVEIARRQNELIDRMGLPSCFEGDVEEVIDRLASDKKAVNGHLTWILPGTILGQVDIVTGVPPADVEATARAVAARP